MSSIFAKIIRREIPSEILLENEHVIAIKDINPVAPIHILIITKKQIPSIQELADEDSFLLHEVTKAAKALAKKLNLSHYRLLTNCGEDAGQTVFHLHFHLISGRVLEGMA